ncbi:MAG: serine/threonine-protein phosphatase [Pseudomonadales bacterium]|nr:serine/threonine-protein phosphatase [Pseudomonadales bacterium]
MAEYVYDTAISQNLDCKNVKSYLSPMGGFSGDVIFTERTSRGTLFIMLGDFTGHGLPAALGALPISQQFKFLAQRGVSLGDMAEQLNSTLYNYLPSHMFCAANLIELNNDGSQISCWLGGLPDILLIDDQGYIRKALKSHHMALGVVSEKSFKRDVITVNLKDGERLIVYSDGVTDCCDFSGEMLGEARFELMFDGKVKGDDLFGDLVNRIKAFGEGRPQDDDISILEVVAGTSEEMIAKSYSDPGNTLAWRLSTKIELCKHRDMDLIAKVMDLFANRTWLRSKKDQLYNTVVTQLRRLIDLQILKTDWEALGLEDEDEHRQIERLKLLDKVKACPIFIDIWYQPETSILQIVVSDHVQQTKSDFIEYKSEIIDAQKISFVNKMEGTLSLATETLIY